MNTKTNKFDAAALPLLIIGGLLTLFAFVFTFTLTPPQPGATELPGGILIDVGGVFESLNKLPLFSQKIFYFHMPVAVVSFASLIFTAIYGILFLRTRDSKYDMRAKTATEMALVFVLMTMVSGLAWTRHDWGVWWSWEPRLTTYFILMLMVFGYFILRTAVSDPERKATYSAVFGIIVFINAPISFMVTRLIPSVHPVVVKAGESMPPLMVIPLVVAVVGFACIGFALYRGRLRAYQMEERVETLKITLDELEG